MRRIAELPKDQKAPERAPEESRPCAVCGAHLDARHVDETANGAICSFCGARQDRSPLRVVASNARPDGVGETLRRARTDRGESVDDVAAATRIHERYLRALEDDEPVNAFPGATYRRLFLL